MNHELLTTALSALKGGKTLLYPTDTIWGIGCDATNAEAIERIYAIKERDHSKSMLVLANAEMLSATLPQEAAEMLLHSDRPTTVVLPTEMLRVKVAENLPALDDTVGVRVPKMDFCEALLKELDRPIVSTSANLSGHPSPATYADIEKALIQRIDCPLPDDPSFHHAPTGSSRIIKLLPDGTIQTLRP